MDTNSAVQPFVSRQEQHRYTNSAAESFVSRQEQHRYTNSAAESFVSRQEQHRYTNSALEPFVLGREQRQYTQVREHLRDYNPSAFDKMCSVVSGFNPRMKYAQGNKLASGATADVYHGIELSSHKDVAIKVMKVRPAYGMNLRSRMYKEILLMKKMAHSNITQYLDSYLLEDSLWIVMEYVNGVILSKVARALKIPQEDIAFICHEVLNALLYLHCNGIMHRDVKPRNILLGKDGKVKLIDFGYSTRVNTSALKSLIGTPLYMAPEVIQGNKYDYGVDIWGLGISVIQMIDGECPYRNENKQRILELILKNGTPSIASKDKLDNVMQDFLSCSLDVNPQNRWTASQLLSHDLMKLVPEQGTERMADLVNLALDAINPAPPKPAESGNDELEENSKRQNSNGKGLTSCASNRPK